MFRPYIMMLIMLAVSRQADAAVDDLIGDWVGASTASMSIYGTIHVTRSRISWAGNDNPRANTTGS